MYLKHQKTSTLINRDKYIPGNTFKEIFFSMCLYKLMQLHDTQIVNLVHKWAKQWHRNTNLKIYFLDETEYIWVYLHVEASKNIKKIFDRILFICLCLALNVSFWNFFVLWWLHRGQIVMRGSEETLTQWVVSEPWAEFCKAALPSACPPAFPLQLSTLSQLCSLLGSSGNWESEYRYC